MKRMILTGILAIGAGAPCIMAQAPPPAQAAKAPAPKSKSELEALQALQAAVGDPDKSIAAAENLITKFADTEFKGIALYIEADAYQRKGDSDHMLIFAERVLEVSPQDFRAMLMLANYYAAHTRENDLDREEKLGKVEKYANQVIEMMKTAPKPNPQITDAQWDEARKDSTAESYNYMGLANLTRKKYDVAAANFKSAVEANSQPEPAYMVREASALQAGGKNDEAIALCDKIAAIPNVFAQIKSVTAAVRAAAIKAGGKAPGGEAK
ncbi:MAG: tetratricopeptide repeat protein [Candidatus Solibacter sp.]